ncbi:MAG: shikimate kinase [bacterium]
MISPRSNSENGPGHEAGEPPHHSPRKKALLSMLGRRVRGLRSHQGLSQLALANLAGLSSRFIAQLESGQGNISVGKLSDIARALREPLPALLANHFPESGREDQEARLRREISARLEGLTGDALQELFATLRGLEAGAGGVHPGVIVLVGLRGAGKSTIGPLLAEALGRRFLEMDEEIQDLTGLATAEIFELHGEAYYRKAERDALEHLIGRGLPVVVAVSGGSVTDPAMFRVMRERTLMIWIKADPEEHMSRVVSQGDQRPMAGRLDAMAELRRLLAARAPYFAQARFTSDTSRASPKLCASELVAMIEGP